MTPDDLKVVLLLLGYQPINNVFNKPSWLMLKGRVTILCSETGAFTLIKDGNYEDENNPVFYFAPSVIDALENGFGQ